MRMSMNVKIDLKKVIEILTAVATFVFSIIKALKPEEQPSNV